MAGVVSGGPQSRATATRENRPASSRLQAMRATTVMDWIRD
ncbi:hypothetical protein Y590_06430 [Methylobacterium sp. AMS5]|nr:hypothetical protein Y590_06430 [Methylobacterium sp. AMS5]